MVKKQCIRLRARSLTDRADISFFSVIFLAVMRMICYLYMFLDNDLDAKVENSKRKYIAEKTNIHFDSNEVGL